MFVRHPPPAATPMRAYISRKVSITSGGDVGHATMPMRSISAFVTSNPPVMASAFVLTETSLDLRASAPASVDVSLLGGAHEAAMHSTAKIIRLMVSTLLFWIWLCFA